MDSQLFLRLVLSPFPQAQMLRLLILPTLQFAKARRFRLKTPPAVERILVKTAVILHIPSTGKFYNPVDSF